MESTVSSGVRVKRNNAVPPDGDQPESRLDRAIVRHTLLFMLWPMLLMAPAIIFSVTLPAVVLYGGGALIGLMLFTRSLRSPETLLAVAMIYFPLARIFPMTVLPGVNGTNLTLILLVFFWLYHAHKRGTGYWRSIPGSRPMLIWGALSSLSGITVIFYISLSYLISDVPLEYKAWIDQFTIYFAFVNLISDGRMARRVVIYMLFASMVVLLLGIEETLSKAGVDSMEKSRVLGPQQQPNDFGAYLVYISCILIGILAVRPFKVRRWMLLPWLGALLKVLLATFSRGAYLALAAGVGAITWFRGLRYVVLGVLGMVLILSIFPQLIPSSLRDRMAQTTVQGNYTSHVDASSETRLILWQAAIQMTLESPLLGKGFKAFQHFKANYTSVPVEESDTHNMFLFICSQMGLPALIAFLACIACLFGFGFVIWKKARDDLGRGIGLAAIGLSASVMVVNMFGSRMVNVEVCEYIWIYLAIAGHLFAELQGSESKRAALSSAPVVEGEKARTLGVRR